jgi:hypothetical protein
MAVVGDRPGRPDKQGVRVHNGADLEEPVDPLTHFAITAVVAGGAAFAATAYAGSRRPRWLGVTVLLSIVAVVWGMYAVLAVVIDDLIWRLDHLIWQTEP